MFSGVTVLWLARVYRRRHGNSQRQMRGVATSAADAGGHNNADGRYRCKLMKCWYQAIDVRRVIKHYPRCKSSPTRAARCHSPSCGLCCSARGSEHECQLTGHARTETVAATSKVAAPRPRAGGAAPQLPPRGNARTRRRAPLALRPMYSVSSDALRRRSTTPTIHTARRLTVREVPAACRAMRRTLSSGAASTQRLLRAAMHDSPRAPGPGSQPRIGSRRVCSEERLAAECHANAKSSRGLIDALLRVLPVPRGSDRLQHCYRTDEASAIVRSCAPAVRTLTHVA